MVVEKEEVVVDVDGVCVYVVFLGCCFYFVVFGIDDLDWFGLVVVVVVLFDVVGLYFLVGEF